MMKRNYSRVVVITGASAGVGRAIAREFARQGARIGLIARDRERLETTKREVEKRGGQAIVCPADVADPDAIETAAEEIEQSLGPIDIWVNNAMATVFSPVKATDPSEVKRVMEVTFLGYVHGTMSALKRMLPRDRGVIVDVGSALAYRGIPLQASYCAAKSAILGFFESLRAELIHDQSNVKLTMVQLPAINTPQFDWMLSRLPRKGRPVAPVFQPEVAARAVVWAADHPRREYYLGFSTVKAIYGGKFGGALADHIAAHQGYEGQMDQEPEDPLRPNNLWKTVPGNFGAHGRFDHEASNFSVQFWISKHRRTLGVIALGAFAALLFGRRQIPHHQRPQSQIQEDLIQWSA